MLPTDIKNLYINSKEVSALWYGGNKIWTLNGGGGEVTGLGTGGFSQFNDWASLSAVTQSGSAANYFSVGDTFTVTMSDNTTASFIVVGINHENNNGLIMMSTQPHCSSKWTTKETTAKMRYGGSLLPGVCNSVGNKLPSELQAIVQSTTVRYNYTVTSGIVDGTGSITSADYKYWIPSICEIFEEAKCNGIRAKVGTQWEFFKDKNRAKAFLIPEWFWCRDTTSTYPARDCISANSGSGWVLSSSPVTGTSDVIIVFRI